jgi:hypothetical protein
MKLPKFLAGTFLNANIIGNFKNPLVSREQLNFMEDIKLKGGKK